MQEIHSLLLFLILLSIGKTPADLKEFARIKGEWEVVSVEIAGKKTANGKWGTKTIIISAATGAKEQPLNSIAQWGRLNTRRSPSVIESRGMTIKTDQVGEKEEGEDPLIPRFPVIPGGMITAVKSQTLYEVKGDTMKLLITPIDSDLDKLPTKFATEPDGKGTLFELKRKAKKASASKPNSNPNGK